MLRYILGRLFSSLIVLWVLVTVSFFLMRFAPGGPFDQDKKLPPTVEANKWMRFKMGVELVAPVSGEVSEVAEAFRKAFHSSPSSLPTVQPTRSRCPSRARSSRSR